MIRILSLALGDLADRRILAILGQALLVTALLFVMLGIAAGWALAGSDPCALAGIDSCPIDGGTSGIGAFVLMLLAAWFLFPGVAVGVLMGFADRIAAAVEQRHYPAAAAAARPIGIGRGALMGVKSAGRILLFNLIALPFYLVLIVTGVGPFILFVIVNGLAFGRDLAELAAARHGTSDERRVWLKRTRGEQGLLGTIVSILFLVPFANLLAPILGAAMAIHLYNRKGGAV
ncbi:MAG: EI24 domain-containing protein [Sphingomicrobium sp.]